ncbi:MAG TPA: N-succinylglutamate 5-semialdehyde dehydrogenase, partial [Erythrobacter sp.]|nr:N-succinylglutamate 5-semialdehyde dehydrogenase [Erythrobacter sp.]
MTENSFITIEPATGAEILRVSASDIDDCVARARAAWPAWAARPLSNRIELVRRFANHVRKVADEFAELIARETGKPLWEAKTEVDAVINKVEISVKAYADRTGNKKLDSALQGKAGVRHKPHGVMAVLGPYNFPAHLPNGHIVPALIAGNVVVFKPSEKTPAVGESLVDCCHKAGTCEELVQLAIRAAEADKALVSHR